MTTRGSCHCGNIQIGLRLSMPIESYTPRACDCDFCSKHGASYISDPAGSLRIEIKRASSLGTYRQGSKSADFLFCRECGVLMGVTYQHAGKTFAAVNSRTLDEASKFQSTKPVSPKTLSAEQKTARWKDVWFSDVDFHETTRSRD